MAFTQKISLTTITMVLTMSATLAGCAEEKVAGETPIRPVKVVEVTTPDQGRIMQYSGAIRSKTEIAMGFRVDGKIVERFVDIGQSVKPGEVLARLDSVDYELSVRQAEAELASAEKQVEIAQRALRRAEFLQGKSATSQSALEQSQLAFEQAVSLRAAAASVLEQTRNKVAYSSLKSEVDGIVTAVSAEAGQVVAAGTPVVSVAAAGSMEVEIAVPEVDIAVFKPGKAVKAHLWANSDLKLDGKVREVAGSADSRSRTFAVRVSLPDDPRLLLGMTATVTAKGDDAVPAYVLPLSALSKQDGKPAVWLVDPQTETVRLRPVVVAGFSDDGVRVTEGVAAGDLVVAAGTQFMQPDMKVHLFEGDMQRAGEVVEAAPPAAS
ncbi:efflux RND transporter periplasmic adaptor subunit [Rhizobium sp. ARZ01]|uniref:efflux RND transporter periplasmic adaptor subunit n=1 Tax=Rhizobium sp. ARZ01 TaxID=2769313 RepID=UPI0017825BB3|nr:efflux RND transporter periplasmic adaptor subunit [Rhizobium sp. ARZ01]MBD9375043.1 efflux RND transporter periplasmic adaptor subunit [Rhizobium sp. ARZ01]